MDTGQTVSVADTWHNSLGQVRRTSIPHILTGVTLGSFLESDWTGYNGADTLPVYDELGRVTQTTLPDGQVTKAVYDGWHREGIDQKGRKRRYESDWAGRTVAVKEYTGTASPWTLYATTTYQYDTAGQLLQVTDALNNVTALTYDNLGRKTGMVDPDMGLWTYEYDPIGTLAAQTDAKEQRTEYGYDALKRLTRSWHAAFWTQDTLTGGVHRPCVYDLMELRYAVETSGRAAGLSTGVWANSEIWTDPDIVAGTGTPIKAVHFTELRDRLQDLWTAAGLGTIPQFTDGAIAYGTRVIKTSDPQDLRKWLSQYEASPWARTRRARACYRYDETAGGNKGIGRRTSMWDGIGRQPYTYDIAGRLIGETRVIDGEAYTVGSTYDALDRPYQVTLPDNEVLTNSYGIHGMLTGLSSSLGTTYLSSVEYNALGQPKRYLLGGSSPVAQTFYGIDYQTTLYPFGALRTIRWPESGTALVDRTMSYD